MNDTLTTFGSGHPVLLLHGGGGPATVLPWGRRLAESRPAHVLVPTHPGFAGSPRPASLTSIRGLAQRYADLLDELDLRDVTVVGNSIGGWIAAELAALGSPRVSSTVLVDAVGLEVPGHPYVDFFALTPTEVAEHSYADPAAYAVDPASLPPEVLAAMPGNRAALEVYGGTSMSDPTLKARLAEVTTPTLVVWGEADRIGVPAVGAAYAEAIPGARLVVLPDAGHLPQIEAPEALVELVRAFADAHALLKPPHPA